MAALVAPFVVLTGDERALEVVPAAVALLLAGTAWNLTRRRPHREPALVGSSVALRVTAVGLAGSVCTSLLLPPVVWQWIFVVPLALLAFVIAGFWHLAALCRIVGACHARVVCMGMAWGLPPANLALILWFTRVQRSVLPTPLGWLALALLLGTPAVALIELSVVRGKLDETCADAWAWVDDRAPGPASWHHLGRMVRASLAAFIAIATLLPAYTATRYRSCGGRLVAVERTAVPSNWQRLPLQNEQGIAPFAFSSWQRPSRTPTPHDDARLVAPDLCPGGISLGRWFDEDSYRYPAELRLRHVPGTELYVVAGAPRERSPERFVAAFSVDRTPRHAFTQPAAATVSSTLAALSLAAAALLAAVHGLRRRANRLRGAPGWIAGTLLPNGMIDLHPDPDRAEHHATEGEPVVSNRLQLVGTLVRQPASSFRVSAGPTLEVKGRRKPGMAPVWLRYSILHWVRHPGTKFRGVVPAPGPVMIPPGEIERALPYRGFPRIPAGAVILGDRDDAAAEAWVAAHRANIAATCVVGLFVVAVLVAAWGFAFV